MPTPLLYQHWPTMQWPHIDLCELPTPVQHLSALAGPLDIAQLYVKRDDLTASVYGGNKVRKLEFLLAEAQRRRAKRVLTFGYAGSNFALATALYAKRLGMDCTSVLLAQKPAPYVTANLRYAQQLGAKLKHYASTAGAARGALWNTWKAFKRESKKPFWISAGGSDPLGVLGFVNATYEIAEQVERGDMPRPDVVYCALGSMGTAAGLSIGFAALGWQTQVVCPRVVKRKFASRKKLHKLIKKTCALLRSQAADFPVRCAKQCNVDIREEFFGAEYGDVTPETAAAIAFADEFADAFTDASTEAHLHLDGTYSAKAFAALMQDKAQLRDKTVLFWNTHNSAAFPDTSDVELPRDFRRYNGV